MIDKFNTKIARYLVMTSKAFNGLRSHIPSGHDACTFTDNGEVLNWYEFIDLICNSYHPFNAKITTGYSVIEFDSFSLEWKFGKDTYVTESGEIALKSINELTAQARILINFNNFEA